MPLSLHQKKRLHAVVEFCQTQNKNLVNYFSIFEGKLFDINLCYEKNHWNFLSP